jgi:uncharacterized protein YciI
MARFLVLTTFTSQEGRLQHRTAHRAHLARLADAGTLLMAGPFADESGGMIVFEADDETTVQSIMHADPFSVEGVFASVDIKPVTVVAGS